MSSKKMSSWAAGLAVALVSLHGQAADAVFFDGASRLSATGVVKSVDAATHTVVVTDGKQHEASFNVTDAASLAKVSPGAAVTVTITRSAKVTVDAPGAPVGASTVSLVHAQVEGVEPASGVIALKAQDGSTFHVRSVANSAPLASLKAGTPVTVAFAPQVSVAVAPAAAQ